MTWRLPHATLEDLERARDTLDEDGALAPLDVPIFEMTTCQRVLLAAQDPGARVPEDLAEDLAGTVDVPGAERFCGFQALRHLAEVASSLDALVPGEDQVPGQFRKAVRAQAGRGRLTGPLHGTLQRVTAMARTVRADSGLQGHANRCLADLAKPMIPDDARVALIGTGQMARATRESLGADRVRHVVSREEKRAREFAGGDTRAWDRGQFTKAPPAVDAVVLCTRARHTPVLEVSTAQRLLDARGPRDDPLLVVDMGLPRNADPSIATLHGLDLRTLGDLARVARGRLLEDEHVTRARRVLERVLQRERARQAKTRLEGHITALRSSVDQEVRALVDELAEAHPGLDQETLEHVARQARGRLAHACQEHLIQAVHGEDPA